MATYRVISLDVRTGTRIAELNATNLRYSSRLNTAGELQTTIPLPPLNTPGNTALAATINDAVDECRRQIVVERDNVIVWSGIIWLAPYKDNPPSREIRAGEDWSYWSHRVIAGPNFTFNKDQLGIAKDLLMDAQAASGGNVGVTFNTPYETSPITRTRTFNAYELKPVAEAIEQLAACDNGFDFAIEASWDATTGALVRRFRPSYPRRGRNYQQTGFVFEVGRNVVDWTWPTDGTRVGNKVWAAGRGEGTAMLISSVSDTWQIQDLTSGGPGYPLLEVMLSNGDNPDQSTLDARARARLQAVATPVVLPEITVRADVDPILGSYITGDACRFIVPPGVSPRFPNGLDTYRRIVGWDVSVSDEGAETVKLLLGEEPVNA